MMEKELSVFVQKEKTVLVEFYADWCNPCQTMEPILEELEEYFRPRLIVVKIDVDQHKKMSRIFKVQSVPTFVLFRKGKQVWRGVGLFRQKELNRLISDNL